MKCPKCGGNTPKNSAYCIRCGAACGAAAVAEPSGRCCILCGCAIPENNLSDICDLCLSGGDVSGLPMPEAESLPAFEESIPNDSSAPKNFPKWILPVVFAAILLIFGSFFLFKQFSAAPSSPSASDSELSDTQLRALSFAQEMVKAAAFDPSSVHFRQNGLSVSKDAEIYTITQRFDRKTSAGETLTAPYTASLTLDPSLSDGYRPLRLEVDGTVLFDYGIS